MSPVRLRDIDDVGRCDAVYLLVTDQEIDMAILTTEETQLVHGAAATNAMTAFTPPSPGSPPPARGIPVGPGHFQPI